MKRRRPADGDLRVACIGAGWVTRERHLPALSSEPRVRVVGVVDAHADRARDAAEAFGVAHRGTSLDESWLTEVDAVTIGAPPLAHAAVIGAALDRGWHTLCEKPLAFPAAEAGTLAQTAAE